MAENTFSAFCLLCLLFVSSGFYWCYRIISFKQEMWSVLPFFITMTSRMMSRMMISFSNILYLLPSQLSFSLKPSPAWTQSFIPLGDTQSRILKETKQLPQNKYSISSVVTPSASFIFKALEEIQGVCTGCKDFLLEESAAAFPPPAVNSPKGMLISKGKGDGWERDAGAGGGNWTDSH